MKKLLAVAAFAALSVSPAYALKYYLVKSWFQGGNQMCQYGNGTVLNVGVRTCPMSIEG